MGRLSKLTLVDNHYGTIVWHDLEIRVRGGASAENEFIYFEIANASGT